MPVTEAPQHSAKPAPVAADTVDWRSEYGQVFADLRQLLVISVVLVAVMVGLGFII